MAESLQGPDQVMIFHFENFTLSKNSLKSSFLGVGRGWLYNNISR